MLFHARTYVADMRTRSRYNIKNKSNMHLSSILLIVLPSRFSGPAPAKVMISDQCVLSVGAPVPHELRVCRSIDPRVCNCQEARLIFGENDQNRTNSKLSTRDQTRRAWEIDWSCWLTASKAARTHSTRRPRTGNNSLPRYRALMIDDCGRYFPVVPKLTHVVMIYRYTEHMRCADCVL